MVQFLFNKNHRLMVINNRPTIRGRAIMRFLYCYRLRACFSRPEAGVGR